MNNNFWVTWFKTMWKIFGLVPRRIECPNTRQSLRQLPVNEEMLGIFMNSQMWASVHLDRWLLMIQQMVSSTQNQIQSLHERELSGLQEQLGWDPNPWKSVFADSVLCLGGKSVLCLFEKSLEYP